MEVILEQNLNSTIMKTIRSISIVALLFIFAIGSAQTKTESVKIKTSAQCESCKARIEKALSSEPGVQSSNLDVKTKVITVNYVPTTTNPDKIKTAISKTGYDADNVKADLASYNKLPGCCKKSSETKM